MINSRSEPISDQYLYLQFSVCDDRSYDYDMNMHQLLISLTISIEMGAE